MLEKLVRSRLNFVINAHLTAACPHDIIFAYKINAMTEKANPRTPYRELSVGEKTAEQTDSTHSQAAARKFCDQ